MHDSFQVLRLPPTATVQEIRHAYLKLALLLHPDKVHGEEAKHLAKEEFHLLRQAYERALLEANHRDEHQQQRHHVFQEMYMSHPQKGIFVLVGGNKDNPTEFFFFPQVNVYDQHVDLEDFDCRECTDCNFQEGFLSSMVKNFKNICSFFRK
jgi:curved DNA-binding protein CbpA